jgi:3'5'-cyclic nucleotide phosphodiesterase
MRLKPAIYSLFNTSELNQVHVPINPNFLTFTDKKIEVEYFKRLYCKSPGDTLSDELKINLVHLYVFITLMCICYGIFSVLYYTNTLISSSHLYFHISFLAGILFFAYILLYSIHSSIKSLFRIRLLILSLGCFIYTYLILGKESILSKIIGDEKGMSDLPLSIGIISFTMILRIGFLDSFFFTFLSVVFNLFFYLIINLSISSEERTSVFSEFFIILITLSLQLIETQNIEYRSKQIFWLTIRDENNFKVTASINNKKKEGINTETELLIKACENIQKTLKEACCVIIYKDIKDSLKTAQIELECIKQRISNAFFSNEIRIEDDLIDSEDKEFISQNFIDIGYKSNDKLLSQGSITSFIDKLSYPFSHYDLNKLESVLSQIGNNWNFDIWFIHETTGKSLSVVGKYLFLKWNLIDFLTETEDRIDTFFEKLEEGYFNNPYHNSCHAADVLHSDLFFIMQSHLNKSLTQLELICCIIASLGHDIGHPSVTNRFLVNNRDKIAVRYNDQSVLENMHASITYKILTKSDTNILNCLSPENWIRSRKMMIEMILATDVSHHFEILGKFRTRAITLSNIDIENFEDRTQVLSMGLKCSDLGHSAKETELHEKWTKLVCEEFFNQGDLEKQRGQNVSMYCDRHNTDIPKSQAGFLKNICLPLYEVWISYLESKIINDTVLAQLKLNLEKWSHDKKRRETYIMSKPASNALRKLKSTK